MTIVIVHQEFNNLARCSACRTLQRFELEDLEFGPRVNDTGRTFWIPCAGCTGKVYVTINLYTDDVLRRATLAVSMKQTKPAA